MSAKTTTITIGGMITAVITFLIVASAIPFTLLWAINTVFTTGIAYTFENWVATSVILIFIMLLNGNFRKH